MLGLRHLSKTYANGTAALSDVSLDVAEGEIVAVVGGSGCGKSTLLRLVAGLDQPSAGSIRLGADAITRPHPAIGIVFQEPRLLPWLTNAGNVGFGLEHLGRSERDARVEAALARVHLADVGGRWPKELSGGQAQRIALARALIAEPRVMLLDEPFSALDGFTRRALHAHLLELWSESRPTTILVTHDLDEALTLADRVIVLQPHPGRIAAEFRLDLPRPRQRGTASFEAERARISAVLDATLAPADRLAS